MKNSNLINKCQICNSKNIYKILDLGYMPPVNNYHKINEPLTEEVFFPTEIFFCPKSKFFQLSCVVNKEVIFPKTYPYTSSTTKVLRNNFKQLSERCFSKFLIDKKDLIIDIGSNDGNLLSNFKNKMRVLGVTPEDVGKIAIKKGIPTILDYFDNSSVFKILTKYGKAKIITATNVFAHIDHPHKLVRNILKCLKKNGVFIAEVHYVSSLIKTLQYDTIYHEHMRYYSLYSLQELLGMHGLKIFDAEIIETHGGSLRIYASTKKNRITNRCQKILISEKKTLTFKNITKFRIDVHRSKIKLLNLINSLKLKNKTIYAIGAPSRASTLVNFVGLDRYMIDCILERTGSYKINKLMPGTNIPVLNENIIKVKKPDYLLILSWHIYKELIDNFRSMNYKGRFIIPLPKPKIL